MYSLQASLQKFKGERGFRRLLDAGRLTFLSFFGEFQASQNEVFEKRSEAVMTTRQCLMELNDLFDAVDSLGSQLLNTFDRIIETLEVFHSCCDNEIVSCTDDEAILESQRAFDLQFEELRKQNALLKASYTDFSIVKSTPKRINSAAMQQVESAFLDASKLVGGSQTDLDVHRRRVQVRENDLKKVQNTGNTQEIEYARTRLRDASETLEAAGHQHLCVVREAMDSTRFALEQVAMASWSSSNVFFAQLHPLFNGFGASTRSIANICCQIKNMQSVSKRISEEKAQALSRDQQFPLQESNTAEASVDDLFPLQHQETPERNETNSAIPRCNLDDLFQ